MKIRYEISSIRRYDRIALLPSDNGRYGAFLAQPTEVADAGETYTVKRIDASDMPGARHAAGRGDIEWFKDALGFPDEANEAGLYLPRYEGLYASFQRPAYRGRDVFPLKSFIEFGFGAVQRVVEDPMDVASRVGQDIVTK